MTLDDAKGIRAMQLQRVQVPAADVREALRVIADHAPLTIRRSTKERLPRMPWGERHRMNAILLLNIGRALGRLEAA